MNQARVCIGVGLAALLVAGCTPAVTPEPTPTMMLSRAQALEAVKQCMVDKGWEVTVGEGGAIEGFAPNGQELQYEADSNECFSAYREPGFEDYSEGDLRRIYDSFVVTRDCQIEHGAALPAPPSYQSWSEIKGQWNPYADIPESMSTGQLMELQEACPAPMP